MRVSIRTTCRLCVVSTACPTTARENHRSGRRWGKTYRAADACKSLRNPGKLLGWFSDVPCSNPKMAQLQAAKLISQGNLWRLASQGIFAAQQSLLDRPIAQLNFPALTGKVDDLPTRKAQRVDHRSQYAYHFSLDHLAQQPRSHFERTTGGMWSVNT